ncbi:LysE family transporter [Suttonella sp. R2A3]|uniref:LysE family translocator n=1 Tax=Suttonella sp. R2A3 TaxID=2908648 RepID=UPI001F4489C3|nr:LysE family transporter [Suttonella sp. R2A3]UJF24933.1 LysE family transporter [Suttonella sp. R2A3]
MSADYPGLSQFTLLAIAHFLALMSPGPDFAVIISQSVRHGRRLGIITALGIGCGIGVHVAYTLLGIGILLKSHLWLMWTAKLLGAGYLLWLSWHLLRARPATSPIQDTACTMPDTLSAKKAFWRGFLTNATNPKATLFFLAIFTTVVAPSTPLTVQAFYGLWMCITTALWFVLVATLFSRQSIRAWFNCVGHWFDRVMGGVLCLFALRLLLSKVHS